jgi:hypothetical protein
VGEDRHDLITEIAELQHELRSLAIRVQSIENKIDGLRLIGPAGTAAVLSLVEAVKTLIQ